VVVVRGVVKAFGDRRVLDEVSLDVPAGASVAILGPSGSGKTTLLRLIAGLEVPDAGEIAIGGRTVSRAGRVEVPPHQRGIGFVFQSSALWPHMTAAQNVAFGMGGRGDRSGRDGRAGRVASLLADVGLAGMEDRYPDQLSGGEARRVALARAIAADPALLLMDEPLTNLDADRRAQLLGLIVETVARTGATLVYVTHEAEEAARVGGGAGRVVVLEGGRVAVSS